MYIEFQIAKEKHAALDAQYNSARIVEGMTVETLNIFDRALQALRTMLTRRAASKKSGTTLTRGTLARNEVTVF